MFLYDSWYDTRTIFSFILIMMGIMFFAFGLGKAQYELGELEQPKKTCNFATRLCPDYVEACINLGTVYGKENNLDEAMKFYNKAITEVAIFLERHFL